MAAFAEVMQAFTAVTSTGAFMEVFTDVVEALADVLGAFTDVTSTEAFVKASVQDMDDMTASTETTCTGASTKAFA